MRPGRARLLAVGVAVLTVLVGSTTSISSARDAQPRSAGAIAESAAPAPSIQASGPTMLVAEQSTYVPASGALRASLLVRNAPAGSFISTTLHRRVRDRAEFTASIATGDDFDLPPRIATFDTEPDGDLGIAIGDVPSRGGEAVLDSVIPIRVPDGPTRSVPDPRPVGRADEQTLDEAGAYPVQYRLLSPDGSVLARVVTHLVRLPEGDPEPTSGTRLQVATVLPLDAPPVLQPDGNQQVDDAVVDRITTIVDGLDDQPDLPVTVDVNAQAITSLVRSDEDAGTDTLARLDQVVDDPDHQVLTDTYAGVDVRAFTDAALVDEIGAQRIRAIEAVRDQLTDPDLGTWVAQPDLSPATVTRLAAVGVTQLVVPERILSPLDDRWGDGLYEPFKVLSGAGVPTPAVQADRRLQSAFTRSPGVVLNAHQLVAELTVIAQTTGDDGATPEGVVVMPPEQWAPNAAFLTVLLDALDDGSAFMQAATVDQIFDTIPPAAANGSGASDRGGDLTRTLTPEPADELGSYPTQLRTQRTRLASLESIVGPAGPPTRQARELLDVSGASALSAPQRTSYVVAAAGRLSSQFARVTAPATEQVTLTARDAEIPMTVTSDLARPSQVVIELEGSNRLEFPDGDSVPATLQPGRNRIEVSVRAPTSGDSPLRMRVLSPDRQVVLAETRYTVRSTAVSGVGLILTIGAFGFLVVWWARHWRKTRRHGRHASAERHPVSTSPPEPQHDPDAPTDPGGVPAVSGERDQ